MGRVRHAFSYHRKLTPPSFYTFPSPAHLQVLELEIAKQDKAALKDILAAFDQDFQEVNGR
jgi:hypothetical protein